MIAFVALLALIESIALVALIALIGCFDRIDGAQEWVDVRRGGKGSSKDHKVGSAVYTPYGEGTVVKTYPGVTSVRNGFTTPRFVRNY